MSKELKAKVTLDVEGATKKLDLLAKKINAIDRTLNKRSQVNKGLNATLNQATKQVNNLDKANQRASKSANKIGNGYKNANKQASILTKNLRTLISAYIGLQGLQLTIGASDTITKAENRLNAMNGNNAAMTQETLDKIYASAQKSRTGYGDMLGNVSKSMTLAPDAFQGNIDNAIRFQEIMAKTYTLGGASAAEQASSMYQLIQGLGSGILQGDELRSVREGAPLAYKAIEEFAQGIYGADKNLKDLASDGLITSDIVVAAIMRMGEGADSVDAKFANTAMTFEQAWLSIKNTALKSFEPVLQMLNAALRSSAGQGIINGIGTALQFVAGVLQLVFTGIANVYNFIVDNWSIISKVVMSVISVIAVAMAVLLFPKFISWIVFLGWAIKYYIILGVQAVASAIKTAAAWAMAHWPLLLIIAILAALVVAVIWVSDSFADACGIIVGVIMATGALILNIAIGVINGILQLAFSLIAPIISVVEWILNVCQGGFDSFGAAVANLIGQIISWFLNLGQVVTKIIDAIFGTNWTAGLESLKSKVVSWGKNNNAITLKTEAPELDRIKYSDAYNFGYDIGVKGGNWISDKASSIGDTISGALNMGNLPGTDFAPGSGGFDMDKIGKGVGDTADNTGKMADSMEMADEELELLRKMAELEWKKEYTTANITLDVVNNNSINSGLDMDGVVTRLTDTLYEELDSLANGVYPYSYSS